MVLVLKSIALILAIINLTHSQCLNNIMWVTAFKSAEDFDVNESEDKSETIRLVDLEQQNQQYEVIKIENNKQFDKLCTELIGEIKTVKYLIVNVTGVREIDAGAFHQATDLETIEMMGNHLKQVRHGIFNNLTGLKVLHLPMNEIHRIDENAFDNLPELTEIDLSVNEIRSINPNWFKGSIKLRSIDLADNAITTIPFLAFQYLNPYLTVNIDLQNNKLKHIETGAFGNLPRIGLLQLRRNRIREVPDMFSKDLEEARKIGLNKNRITCIPEVVLQKLNRFDEIRINRNPIGHNCILRRQQFLTQNKGKYFVDHIKSVSNYQKKARPYGAPNRLH